ncbi:MAG TPA: hypothetical protein VLJ21_02660 [Candidatus Binatia bacterium]|nr:hypothetical protein [Candidatus Binatia bacterium]
MKPLTLALIAVFLAVPVLSLTVPLILEIKDVFTLTASLSSTKLTPLAGAGANLTINATTSQPASLVALFGSDVIDLEGTTSFSTTLALPFSLQPGNYTITLTANNGTDTASKNLSFEYLPLEAVLLDVPALTLSGLAPGTTIDFPGDNDLATDLPTLWNGGNVPINIGIAADTPANGTEKVALANVQVSLNGTYLPLKTSYQNITLNLQPNETVPLNIRVTVPNASAGNYVGAFKVIVR